MKRIAWRTCIGCSRKQPKDKLKRLVVKKGKLIMDLANKPQGRGAYLCKKGRGLNKKCWRLAINKNAFKKAFKEKIDQINFKSEPAG